MCEMLYQIVQKKQEGKRIEKEQAAEAQNWKLPVCYDDDDDVEMSNSLQDNIISGLPPCSAVTPNEPIDSLNMRDEHLNTIPATESDKSIKSRVKNLVPNPSESKGKNGCDVLACFTTFSNILFDADDESDSSDYQLCSDEDFQEEIYSNPLFEEEIISIKIDQHHFNAESDLVESMLNRDSSVISSSSKIDSLLDEFVSELTLLKSIPPGIDKTDCHPKNEIHFSERLFDSHMEEIDLSFNPDDPMPPSIEDDDNDSEGDNLFLERLLHNDPILLPDTLDFDFSNVIRVFHPFFTYPVTSSLLLTYGSEDTIFDPDISNYYFSSFKPDLSHRLFHLAGSQPMLKSSYKAEDGVIISIPPLVGGVADVVVEIKGTGDSIPGPEPITPLNEGTSNQNATKSIIERHVSALKELLKEPSNRDLIKPMLLDFDDIQDISDEEIKVNKKGKAKVGDEDLRNLSMKRSGGPCGLICKNRKSRGMAYAGLVQNVSTDPRWKSESMAKRKQSDLNPGFVGKHSPRNLSYGTPVAPTIASTAGGVPSKENLNKYCDYHNKKGHTTNDCFHLKKKLEIALEFGKLNHLVKDVRQRGRAGQRNICLQKGNVINMVQCHSLDRKRKTTMMDEKWMNVPITFPPVMIRDLSEEALVVEAKVEGYVVRRIHIDEGASVKIMFEHCFNKVHPLIRSRLFEMQTTIYGFSGAQVKPLGKIELDVCFMGSGLCRRAIMKFTIIPEPSPYNIILGRPSLKQLRATPRMGKKQAIEPPKEVEPQEEVSITEQVTKKDHQALPQCQPLSDTGQSKEKGILVREKPNGRRRRGKTAFYTDQGTYYYTKIPSGLKNAGATYHRLVDEAFRSQIRGNLEAYVDDMVIKSKSEREMLADIAETFDNLRIFNMKQNPKKCSFRVEEGKFLGCMVTSEGIRANPAKTKDIVEMQSLPFFKTLKDITEENKDDYRRTEKAKSAFQELKKMILDLPSLTTPLMKETLFIYLAASGEAVSAVLLVVRKGKQYPVHYVSKTLHDAKRNNAPLEKVALALRNVSRRLRRYFKAHPITVITYQPIKQIISKADTSGRVMLSRPTIHT
nr:reverse transcriptase domain-containing protein [Tanacetum cinerariifolium]